MESFYLYEIGEFCKKKKINPEDERVFRSHFCYSKNFVVQYFMLIEQYLPVEIQNNINYFLIFLYYLKCYPTEDVGSAWANFDKKTFKKYIFIFLDIIASMNHMATVTNITILDCSEFPIERPQGVGTNQDGSTFDMQKEYYSGKKKKHILKYQFAVTNNGLIIDVFGPFKGKVHDFTICQESNILNFFQGQTNFFGDMAYIGDNRIHTPFKGRYLAQWQRDFNKQFGSQRVIVENCIGRLKHFKICKDVFRNKITTDFHPKIIKAISNMSNLNVAFFEPLRIDSNE